MSRFARIQVEFVIASLFLLATASQAQVSEDWLRQYDGSNHYLDDAGPMAVDHAGNVIAAGQSRGGFLTIKYSAEGDTVWMLADAAGPAGSIYDLTVDAEDNIYVTGYTYTGSAYSGDQWVTSKYSPDGLRGWSRAFDGQGGPAGDCGYGVAVDDSGYVYVTGISTMDNRSRITTLKYDSEGVLSHTWPNIGNGIGVRRYENVTEPGTEYGYRVAVDEESNVYVTGVSPHPVGGSYDFLTLKYSATGQEVWCQRYDGPAGQGDTPVAIALDDSANVFVAGTTLVPNQSGADRTLQLRFAHMAPHRVDPGGLRRAVLRPSGHRFSGDSHAHTPGKMGHPLRIAPFCGSQGVVRSWPLRGIPGGEVEWAPIWPPVVFTGLRHPQCPRRGRIGRSADPGGRRRGSGWRPCLPEGVGSVDRAVET